MYFWTFLFFPWRFFTFTPNRYWYLWTVLPYWILVLGVVSRNVMKWMWIILVTVFCWVWMTVKLSEEGSRDSSRKPTHTVRARCSCSVCCVCIASSSIRSLSVVVTIISYVMPPYFSARLTSDSKAVLERLLWKHGLVLARYFFSHRKTDRRSRVRIQSQQRWVCLIQTLAKVGIYRGSLNI